MMGTPNRVWRSLALLLAAAVLPAAFAQQMPNPSPQTAQAPQSSADPEWETAAGGKMSFEVASIRPSEPGTLPANISMETDDRYPPTGGLFTADRTLETYINFAYKLHPTPEQREAIYGHLPKWVTTQNFAIQARAAGNVTQKDQMRLMMQSLLAERFQLAVHFEQRDEPVFALQLIHPGRLGPNIRPHAEGPPCTVPASRTGVAPSPASATPVTGSADFPFLCGQYLLMPEPHHMIVWGSREISMARLASWIAITPPRDLGRPVVDQTGLKGKFDFTLEWKWTSDLDGEPDAQSGPTVGEALKQQLGMKLQPTHAPVATLVIDHVEQPSSN